MNKQQLASKIWALANKMRSKIEAYEYKDYILGFIFFCKSFHDYIIDYMNKAQEGKIMALAQNFGLDAIFFKKLGLNT